MSRAHLHFMWQNGTWTYAAVGAAPDVEGRDSVAADELDL